MTIRTSASTQGEDDFQKNLLRMLTGWLTFTALLAGSADPERAASGLGAVSVTTTCRVKGHPEAELILNCGDGKTAGVVQFWHTPMGDLQTSGELDHVFMHQDGSLVVPDASVLHSGLYYCLLQHAEGTMLWPYEVHISQNHHESRERRSSRDAFRVRRDVGTVEDGQFAGAVSASVLLTFVVGFSAGALSRTQVLRCLGTVTTRLRSPRQRQTDSEVTMTTRPSSHDIDTSEEEQATVSSITPPPPAKPQRSFRNKRQDDETSAYLEECDHVKEEEEAEEEVAEQERGGSQTETEEEDGESREEEVEVDGEERRGSEEEEKEGEEEGHSASSLPRPGRRSRVIRLYQYDEDGQRYCHLPDPAPDEPGPAPRPKQRSVSLTRLNAIMAVASTGPLDTRETEREEERPHFHMEI